MVAGAILLDHAAGALKAADIKAVGAIGSIRHVSDRRAGGRWMPGKPIELPEARDLYRHGLKIVANHRYGKGGTADRLAGVGVDVNHLLKPRFGQWDQPMITDQ